MKVLQYNILDGCLEEERFNLFSHWMKKQPHDIVGFNEVNGWSGDDFQQEAENWGYPYSYLFEMESSPYFVGIMARFPIELIKADEESVYHGLIHVKIKGIHFFVTHLTPFSSENREKETSFIADAVSAIENPTVVMGDLNTLSPLDEKHYQQADVIKKLLSNEKSRVQHTKNGDINYIPMQHLLNAGLHDIGYDETFVRSIPTPLKHDVEKAKQLRIDYILGNAAFMDFSPTAKVICDEEVEALSDHYPIECFWNE